MKLTAAAIPFLTVLATLGQSTQALSKDITTAAENTVNAMETLKSEALVGTDANVDAIAADVNAENEDDAALIEEISENGYHHYRRPHSEHYGKHGHHHHHHHHHHHGHDAAKRDLMHKLKKVYEDAKHFLNKKEVKAYEEGLPGKKHELRNLIRRVEVCEFADLIKDELKTKGKYQEELFADAVNTLEAIKHLDKDDKDFHHELKRLLDLFSHQIELYWKYDTETDHLRRKIKLTEAACKTEDGKPCKAAESKLEDVREADELHAQLSAEKEQVEARMHQATGAHLEALKKKADELKKKREAAYARYLVAKEAFEEAGATCGIQFP